MPPMTKTFAVADADAMMTDDIMLGMVIACIQFVTRFVVRRCSFWLVGWRVQES
jgi:hypothetical protein